MKDGTKKDDELIADVKTMMQELREFAASDERAARWLATMKKLRTFFERRRK